MISGGRAEDGGKTPKVFDDLPFEPSPYRAIELIANRVSSRPVGRAYGKPKPKFPWLLFILLLASIYVFWVLPIQLGSKKVNVEFSPPKATIQQP